MAVVVGRAEEIMPAGELRGLLGGFNQGERQQGHDASVIKVSPSIEGLYF